MSKIEKNPNIVICNKDGQVIVKEKPITGTDFESLFKSIISPSQNFDQVGIDSFLDVLHKIGVKYSELSGKAVQNRYTQSKNKKAKNDDNLNEYVPNSKTPTKTTASP